jgi:hypothetical protein
MSAVKNCRVQVESCRLAAAALGKARSRRQPQIDTDGSGFRLICWFIGLFFCGWAAVVSAQAPSDGEEKIQALRPPRAEMPAGFWEQHGIWVVVGVLVILALLVVLLWQLLKPKPPIIVPPSVRAREALVALQAEPETGGVLSRVSQVLRSYFSEAYGLPPAELNTSEFAAALRELNRVGTDLAAAVIDFLRRCDERKFAPSASLPPLGAVAQATRFIDQAEARRAVSEINAPVASGQSAPRQ